MSKLYFMVKPLAALFILFFFISSCQKELSSENTPPSPASPASDSIYLSKLYYIEFDGVTLDTADKWSYTYDNLKRVTSLTDSVSGLPLNIVPLAYTYYYNGTDTLPFKSVYLENYPQSKDTVITYFTYNNAGQRIRDSIYHSGYNASFIPAVYGIKLTIKKYSYGVNKIYGESKDSLIYQVNGNMGIGSNRDTAITDAAGNMINNKTYEFFTNQLLYTSSLTYDNHPSPFSILSNFKTFKMFPSYETFLEEFPQKNNLLTVDGVGTTSGSAYNNDYNVYTYKNNGYPQQILITDPPPSQAYTKIVFVYRAF